jgi:FlaA1/EpsC-like NDP-sugar epimerase
MKLLLVLAHDFLAAAIAWIVAYWLRFNFEIPPDFVTGMLATLPLVLLVQTAAFWVFGLYRGIWRFASLPDLRRIGLAVGLSAVVVPTLLYLAQLSSLVPRSVLVLDPLLLVTAMGGSRFIYRAWREGLFAIGSFGEPAIIVGAGDAAARLVAELGRSRQWHVVGLLDDARSTHGRMISGYRVLGGIDELKHWTERFNVKHVILAIPSASATTRRHITELAANADLTVLTVPALDDILSGRVSIASIRRVELEDLLGREQVQLDDEGLHRLLSGKVVMVTGAGGSIGSELCRQIARFAPERMIFYELSEFALYAIGQEFADQPIVCLVGDVKDEATLAAVFRTYKPDVVFHAAAYKHVPLMENENSWQAVCNNVLGTWRTARAAIDHGVSEFVLISTDKAVNPANVMGTSKRLAERVCEALQRQSDHTRFVVVRFGNVLGSSGSVIPKFREQIAKGGPVTVTHPNIIRYFMLIPEAAQLVLQAGLMGKGGELFVLDMGEPVKIADLARDMIRLSGFSEDDIKVEFTGLRPGEKLYEELLADGETTLPTPHPKLRVMKAETAPDRAWLAELEQWLAAPVRSEAEVKAGLQIWVPEYRPANH